MNMRAWESMSLWVLMRIWEGGGAGGVCVCCRSGWPYDAMRWHHCYETA